MRLFIEYMYDISWILTCIVKAAHHINAMDIFDNVFAISAILAAIMSLFAIMMEKRRHNRINLNKVGFMPWNLISVISILITVIMAAMAIKYG